MSARKLLATSIAFILPTILTILCLLLIESCSTVPHRPSFCEDNDPSRIYDLANQLGVDPQKISALIVIANLEAIERDPLYTAQTARSAIEDLRQLLSHGAPIYYELLSQARQNIDCVNHYAGREIMLLSPFLPVLSAKVPITDCDVKCFRYQLDALEQSLDRFLPSQTQTP